MKLSTLNRGLWPATAARGGIPSFEDAFRQFAGWLDPKSEAAVSGRPALNAWETDDAYHVEYSVPGFTLEDIEVTVHGTTLKVAGTRAEETEENTSYHRRERRTSSFERTVELGLPVDAEAVTAELNSGLLTVHLPKAEESRPRRIEVRA